MIHGNRTINLKAGQLIMSRTHMALDPPMGCGIHPSKIQRMLDRFMSEGMIDLEMINGKHVISIVCWKDYQKTDPKMIQEKSGNDQEMIRDQNSLIKNARIVNKKKGNKGNKGKTDTPDYTDAFEQFWGQYPNWVTGRNDKAETFALWQEISANPGEQDELLRFAMKYKSSFEPERKQYVKGAQVVLKRGRWRQILTELDRATDVPGRGHLHGQEAVADIFDQVRSRVHGNLG